MPTIHDLGQLVKQKYPGKYDHIDDGQLGAMMQAKFPGKYQQFTIPQVTTEKQTIGPQGDRTRALPDMSGGRGEIRALGSRIPGIDYVTGAGRYVEDRLTGEKNPLSLSDSVQYERAINRQGEKYDPGLAEVGEIAALRALPFAKGKGALQVLKRAGQAGTYAAGQEASRGGSAGDVATKGLLTTALAPLGEGAIHYAGKGLRLLGKTLGLSADRAALKGIGASPADIAVLRDRVGDPEAAGNVARNLQTPEGKPVLGAFTSPEQRLRNVKAVEDTAGPLKGAMIDNADQTLDNERLHEKVKKIIGGIDTPEERIAAGVDNISDSRALLRRYEKEYAKPDKVVGIAKPVEGAMANGGVEAVSSAPPTDTAEIKELYWQMIEQQKKHPSDFTMRPEWREAKAAYESALKVAGPNVRPIPGVGGSRTLAMRDADFAAQTATQADREAASAVKAKDTAAGRIFNVDESAAGQRAAEASQAAGQAAQGAEAADAVAARVARAGPNGEILSEADTAPYTQNAQDKIDAAARTATAGDRNAASAMRTADPLEALDNGATDGTRIAKAREAAGLAAQNAEDVEAAQAGNLDPNRLAATEGSPSPGTEGVRLSPDITRPRPGSGHYPVIERQEPMTLKQADDLVQRLSDDVYTTASARNPNRPLEAIEKDPALRLKRDIARAIREEVEAAFDQKAPGAAGPVAPEGARFRLLKKTFESAKAIEPSVEATANTHAAGRRGPSPYAMRHLLLPTLAAAGGGGLGAMSGAGAGEGVALGALLGLGAEAGAHAAGTYGWGATSRLLGAGEKAATGMGNLSIDPDLVAKIAALTQTTKRNEP